MTETTTTVESTPLVAIVAKYHALGSRYTVHRADCTYLEDPDRLTVPYDYAAKDPAAAARMRISRATTRSSGGSQTRSWPQRLGPSCISTGCQLAGSISRAISSDERGTGFRGMGVLREHAGSREGRAG